jgi:hypothetical protein
VPSRPEWRARTAEELPPEFAEEIPMDLLGPITGLPAGAAQIPWAGPDVRIIEHQAHAPGHAALLIEERGVLVAGGTFLHDLSAVERAQPQGLVTGVTMADETARVQCRTGLPATVPLTAGRARVAELLSRSAGPVTPPATEDPETCPEAPDPPQLRGELLDDLGAYLPDLSHADSGIRVCSTTEQTVQSH